MAFLRYVTRRSPAAASRPIVAVSSVLALSEISSSKSQNDWLSTESIVAWRNGAPLKTGSPMVRVGAVGIPPPASAKPAPRLYEPPRRCADGTPQRAGNC